MMMEPIVAPKVFRPRHPLRGEKRSKLELNLVMAGGNSDSGVVRPVLQSRYFWQVSLADREPVGLRWG